LFRGPRLPAETHASADWRKATAVGGCRDDGQHGRGLLVVAHLADDCGRNGDAQTGWMVWFEIEGT
jgi:hypothetical protein